MEFSVKEVITVSCAVQRINEGFVKKGLEGPNTNSNSHYLYKHFCEGDKVVVTDDDINQADVIVDYLKGLGFKALERKLTDFEKKVLEFVQSENIDKSSLGIAASLPNVYLGKVKSDNWADRERELGKTSKFQGNEKNRSTFVATIEFTKWIAATESFLVTASIDNKHILKFFSPAQGKTFNVGDTLTIAGYVKPYMINKYTGFEETMINRVKIDNESADSN